MYSSSSNLYPLFQQDSLTLISSALVEQTVKGAAVYDKFQFERIGFFSVDPDTNEQKVRRQGLELISQTLKTYTVLKPVECCA